MIEEPSPTTSQGAEPPITSLSLRGEIYSDNISQTDLTTVNQALTNACSKPFVMKLILLDINGSSAPLKWPGSWHMLFSLHRILYTLGEKKFAESINMLGHDVEQLRVEYAGHPGSLSCGPLRLVANIYKGWNLRMVVVDEKTVVLGLEQAIYYVGSPTLMASGNLVTVVRPIPSAIDRLRQNPPKLHPRVARLKVKRSKTSLARVKWHGKIIQTTEPNSWAEVTALGTAMHPGFRLIQAQRKATHAKEYLSLSRKVLGLKIHQMEEYGKLHGLPTAVYKCIIKYRNSENLMACLDALEETETGGDPEADDEGTWPVFEGLPTEISTA
ncbi:hypothetical protein P167DRAFT_548593 [Morchella conica CCBAS932]|uniref:Uncharacterized protein n=1 Tax=Morchella conica CCBAS932 TaxID=1392247 RepID=A0A3N4KST3_9PEZI|nr:hypothetical protein P167DRAFT_548593 [Morchella conica CCBAS932]